MIGIIRQQTLLIILFCCAVASLLIMGGIAWQNKILSRSVRGWEAHSDSVLELSADTSKAQSEADLRGRLEMVGISNGTSKDVLRQAALSKIGQLKELVADSPAQLQNASEICEAIKVRFKTQDDTLNAAKRADNTVTTPVAQNINSIESVQRVQIAFLNFNTQEYALWRSRRTQGDIYESKYNDLINFLLFFCALFISVFAYFTRRALKNSERGANRLQRAKDKKQVVDGDDLQELIQMLREGK